MEKLALDISERIANQLNYSEDKKDVIAYGLTALFQLLVIGIISSLLGLLCHFFYESIVIFFCVGLIKKSTGGAHSESIYICTFMSIFIISMLAYFSTNLLSVHMNLFISVGALVIIFIMAVLIIYRRVPVDSPNKPITKPEKIKKLRTQSFIIVSLFLIAASILVSFRSQYPRLQSISYSIQFAVIWQAFMLTKKGNEFIKAIDSIFIKKGL